MKAKNLNASSVKTRNLIRDTFAELLYEKKNINKITVTELVQRADINRSTFYSHYRLCILPRDARLRGSSHGARHGMPRDRQD